MALGFYFDMTRCVGCRACQVACKDRNNLDIGLLFRYAKTYETGSFPDVGMYNYSGSCNHCEHPACITVCPTGAMYKAEDGTVIHDDDMCIGCKACMNICPYGAPKYDEVRKIVRKCDACASHRAKGENPVCVDACPSRALDFGDRDELIAKYGEDLVKDLPILPDSKLTEPNTLIKAKPCALEEDFRELPT
jgi:anaerobic dimethyl sulfoxide reductase subunit B (iron-sulfur subunit)